MTNLLEVRNLSVEFKTADGPVRAIDGLNFDLAPGASLGIVGESGAGKSQTALAIMGLMARNAFVRGSIKFEGAELTRMWQYKRARLRGNRMAMVFQDPMTCLNPYLRIETQIGEVLQRHRGASVRAARAESLRLLQAVQLSDAKNKLRSYPHELSGGQRQRVMIAMALACRPALLLADEPTTALDVTVQAQILALFAELRHEFNVALILITHDLGVVAEVCEQTLVMYAGRGVEEGGTLDVLKSPLHPYTRALLEARPRLDLPLEAKLPALPGQPPDPANLPRGCAFAPRCPIAETECEAATPEWRDMGKDRMAACRRL